MSGLELALEWSWLSLPLLRCKLLRVDTVDSAVDDFRALQD